MYGAGNDDVLRHHSESFLQQQQKKKNKVTEFQVFSPILKMPCFHIYVLKASLTPKEHLLHSDPVSQTQCKPGLLVAVGFIL